MISRVLDGAQPLARASLRPSTALTQVIGNGRDGTTNTYPAM
jgi:hypothetical protein